MILGHNVRVLRGVDVAYPDCLPQILDAYERHVLRRLPGEKWLDFRDQTLARGEQDGGGPGEVLGLGHQVAGDALGEGASVAITSTSLGPCGASMPTVPKTSSFAAVT